jgi:hypothetical protein
LGPVSAGAALVAAAAAGAALVSSARKLDQLQAARIAIKHTVFYHIFSVWFFEWFPIF